MKISINWLKEYIQTESNPVEISEILTNLGLEVEKIDSFESVKGGLEGVVAGKVIKCEKHPNADRLKLTSIDLGNNQISEIVCGAPNIEKGQIVPVAVVGSKIYTNDGTEIKIKKSKIRGVISNGMVCAEDEIGLGDSHDGIMVLDKNIKPGTPISEVFNIENDNILDIGLTPNRCDAMSHYGVARDLKAYYDYKSIKSRLNLPSINSFESVNIEEDFNLDIIDKEKCPFYSGLIIKDIKVKKSSDKLQNKLNSIGLKPINNIVDITNFVMHEIGQPLHAFDFDKLKNINVKSLKSGTKFKTLDDEIIELNSDDLMICSENKPLCIAGIYGGLDSGISDSTKNLFLESDAFVWCSPEYNGGISPILTNVIAWISRATIDWKEGFKDKHSLICTSSGGNGKHFIKGFTLQLGYLGAKVMDESIIRTNKKDVEENEFKEILTKFLKKFI